MWASLNSHPCWINAVPGTPSHLLYQGHTWGSCLAGHWKIFRYQLLLRFASFKTFLKLDNVLKTEGVRKKDLTWDLQKNQLCVLGSSGFLTTPAGNKPNWKLVQQSTVGHNLLAKGSLNQQWNLIWSGLGASVKDCQLQPVPVTGRLTRSRAHYDSSWWSNLAVLVVLPLLKQHSSWGWLKRPEPSWMNRVLSSLGVREQWFTRGNCFVSCDVHHTVLSGFPWLLLFPRCMTCSPQTTKDSQAIGDCSLPSKQNFFSVSQNPSLNLADPVPATTVSSVPHGRLSPLFSCLCCGTCLAWSS